MASKKVLVVTYYWPPSGGSGVQRWLKFVKYMPQVGWKPYVVTPENPSFDVKDESLAGDVPAEAEVIRLPIWEPYDVFFKLALFTGSKRKSVKPTELVSIGKQSLLMKLGAWARGNFFIPDPKIFWVRPVVKYLDKFLKENDIKIMITTGPPHSMHLVGLRLKKKNPSLHWIADFRDPWSEWGLLDTLRINDRVRSKHQKLEHDVLRNADEVITVTTYFANRFSALGGRKVETISNGFDEDDFKNIVYKKTDKFIIRHAGTVNEKSNPVPFMNAVNALCKENKEVLDNILIEFVGDVHGSFRSFIHENNLLQTITRFVPAIPHDKLLDLYGETSALLLIITEYKGAEGYTGGKSFEYIATGLPVIALGPPGGEAAKLLRETSSGEVFSGSDQDKIKNALLILFRQWQSGNSMKKEANDAYSRRRLTQKLVALLDSKKAYV